MAPQSLSLAEFKAFLLAPPAVGPEPDPQCADGQTASCIARAFVSEGDTVVNHYTVMSSAGTVTGHGVAVHRFEGATLVESFWYPD